MISFSIPVPTPELSTLQDLLKPYLPQVHVQSLIHEYLQDKVEELAQPVLKRLLSWDNYETAFEGIKQLLNENPSDQKALDELINFVYFRTEKRKFLFIDTTAITARVNQVEEHFMEYAHVQVQLGFLYADKEIHPIDRKEAERFFRRAITLNPNLADAHAGLGRILQVQKRFQEAETSFLEALRLHGGSNREIFGCLYFVSNELGKFEEALRYQQLYHNTPE